MRFAFDFPGVTPNSVMEFVDVEQAVVGQFVAGGVFEEPFHRIQFRGIRREIFQMQSLVGLEIGSQQFALVGVEIVPEHDDRAADLAIELFDER